MGWILFCSLSIAIYFLISGELTQRLGSGLFTLIAMTAAAIGMAVHYQFAEGWGNVQLAPAAWWTLIALVIFSTVLPLFLMAEGVRRVGASKASLISTLGPPATAIMAYELTGEVLTAGQLIGIVLVVIGVLANGIQALTSAIAICGVAIIGILRKCPYNWGVIIERSPHYDRDSSTWRNLWR